MNKSERRNMLALYRALGAMGFEDGETDSLLRIERTLQRWGEQECGNERGCICRDDETGKPYWQSAQSAQSERREPIQDR
jgi:hypothetical protein